MECENLLDRELAHLKESSKENQVPFMATFELTPLCNFNCNMCYVHLTPEQAKKQGRLLTAEEWLALGRQTAEAGTLRLELTGGEIFTRPDFLRIYEGLYYMGFRISLRSNGYSLTEENLAYLKTHKPHYVQITLYGASDATYQTVCGVRDGFTVVAGNIARLQEAGIQFRVSYTETRENTEDYPKCWEWCKEHGLNLRAFRGLVNPIRSAERDITAVAMRPTDEECLITEDMRFRSYTPKADTDRCHGFARCRNFGYMYFISWDGRMMNCNTLTSYWEEPLQSDIATAFHRLLEKLNAVRRPTECRDCRYYDFCLGCPDKFLSASGDPEKCDEEVCRIARYNYKQVLLMKNPEGTP